METKTKICPNGFHSNKESECDCGEKVGLHDTERKTEELKNEYLKQISIELAESGMPRSLQKACFESYVISADWWLKKMATDHLALREKVEKMKKTYIPRITNLEKGSMDITHKVIESYNQAIDDIINLI